MRRTPILITIIFLAGFGLISSVQAQNASLYLAPSSGSFLVGSTFSISVFVNTEGNEINTISAEIIFPPGLLQITSPTAGTSFITQWLTPPSYSNEKGIVVFQGGIPGGIKTSAGLVSTITFRAAASGKAKISFGKNSKVLLNDGKGTDILATIIDGEYGIIMPPPEGPSVFSPTHPNPDVWYSDANPSFSWEKEAGVNDFSWSIDQNPNGRPDSIGEGPQNMASYTDLKDGIWYFHLRQQKGGIWGKTSNVQVKIDITPPKEFAPQIKTYNQFIDYQTAVYFETADDASGIDHYEVSIVDFNAKEPSRSFFTEQISPYKIPVKERGNYNVIIRAIDKAGNARDGEAGFKIATPLIANITGKGLEIMGVFLPWWLIGLGIILILGGEILGMILLAKRKQKKVL